MMNHRATARASPECGPTNPSSWVIVWAGGQGERLNPFIQHWLGESRPKQYCRFVGRRTMLEHTWARAQSLAPGGQILTVAAPEHRFLLSGLDVTGEILYQPRPCGTAPGVFLPLTAIAAADPHALIHLMPSDHFIYPRERFVRHLALTETIVRAAPDRLVLTAAVPDIAEKDFGWIQPGRAVTGAGWAALTVTAFHEKPDAAQAVRYLKAGYLWNTMIVSCTVATLWGIASRLPTMLSRFNAVREAWSTPTREAAIRDAYAGMPTFDFSRDLLEKSTAECLLLPLSGIAWSDWGRPNRITASVAEYGLQPNYPYHAATPELTRLAS